MDFLELEERVNRYMELESRQMTLNKELDGLGDIPLPQGLISPEALLSYKEAVKLKEADHAAMCLQRNNLRETMTALEGEIINYIGVKGVWVKVGAWAVGFLWDLWSGGHFKLLVSPADAPFPPLTDRTHYP